MKKRRQKMHEDRHAKKTQMMNKSGGNDWQTKEEERWDTVWRFSRAVWGHGCCRFLVCVCSHSLTSSRGRKMSSCRATTTDTLSPCLVLRSMATSSSWLRPVMSTPFTYKHTHTHKQWKRRRTHRGRLHRWYCVLRHIPPWIEKEKHIFQACHYWLTDF